MLQSSLILKNPRTGEIKSAPLGFSWSVLLFGFFVPFYRHDWKWGTLMLITYILTWGLISIPFALIYNKYYARSLFQHGYKLFQIQGRVQKKTINEIMALNIAG